MNPRLYDGPHNQSPTKCIPPHTQDQDLKRYMDSHKTGLDPALVKVRERLLLHLNCMPDDDRKHETRLAG